ncbi:MAG: LysM domain-containing protein [Anaerolineae bacterium]|nr:LysM domain-containing protein [Anaerolineae bacterium]MDQ7034286.1 LysM domain-containing protein [Anaerolineae bacterium]
MRLHYQFLCLLLLMTGITVIAQDDAVLPITEDTNYIIRPADTLDTIGALFDVSPSCLADMNDISNSRDLFVGETLLIAVSCPRYGDDARDMALSDVLIPRDVVTYEEDCDGYRVQRNDSIDLIGFNLNISAVSIAVVNELDPPYILDINQCLIIPEDAPPWGEYPALTTANGDFGSGGALPPGEIYVMQPRDTLDVVAQSFNVSVVAIMLTNNISSASELQPGAAVLIPDDAPAYGLYPAITEPIVGQLYIVQQGETLDEIAEAFDVSVLALEAANNIEAGRNATIGTTLLIPDNVPVYGHDDGFDVAMLGQGGGFAGVTRVVQPRETVDQIAAFFNVNTDCLLAANNLGNPRHVQPGTVLIIDESCGAYLGEGRADLETVTSSAADSTGESGE